MINKEQLGYESIIDACAQAALLADAKKITGEKFWLYDNNKSGFFRRAFIEKFDISEMEGILAKIDEKLGVLPMPYMVSYDENAITGGDASDAKKIAGACGLLPIVEQVNMYFDMADAEELLKKEGLYDQAKMDAFAELRAEVSTCSESDVVKNTPLIKRIVKAVNEYPVLFPDEMIHVPVERASEWDQADIAGFAPMPKDSDLFTFEATIKEDFALCYAWTSEDKIVGTGMFLPNPGNGGIHEITVMADYRRGKKGRRMILQMISDALAVGLPYISLQASALGELVYTGLGFKRVGIIRSCMRVPQ